MPTALRLGVITALAFALFIGVELWERKIERRGYDRAQAEYSQQAIIASESARLRERELQQQVKDAENEAKQREKDIVADVIATRNERDRLRSELATAGSRMSAASFVTVREYASTLSSIFEECAGHLEGMARNAAGHASDSLMYQNGLSN